MADNVNSEAVVSAGTLWATDEDVANSRQVPYSKLMFGADGTFTIASSSNPYPVDITSATIDLMLGSDFDAVFGSASLVATDGSAALTIGTQVLGTDGTNAQIISTNTSGHVNIADGGNNISIDWGGTAPPIGAGTEAGALRVTVATDSTGVLTVDNGGTFAVQAAIDELPAAAALTDNFANPTTSQVGSMGMVWDGATWDRLPGSAADGVTVNLGTNNDVTIAADSTVDLNLVAGTATSVNAGNVDAGTQRVVLASDQAAVTVDLGANNDVSLNAGTNLACDVGLGVRTSGGASFFKSIDLDETEEAVKATAGQVYGYYLHNNTASVVYVKFYDATVATVVVGTTVPDLTIPLPANAAANVSFPVPIAFATAITIAATTGVADNDAGAPAANAVQAMVFFN